MVIGYSFGLQICYLMTRFQQRGGKRLIWVDSLCWQRFCLHIFENLCTIGLSATAHLLQTLFGMKNLPQYTGALLLQIEWKLTYLLACLFCRIKYLVLERVIIIMLLSVYLKLAIECGSKCHFFLLFLNIFCYLWLNSFCTTTVLVPF